MRTLLLPAALALSCTANAQSPIYGVNLRLAESYVSTTGGFGGGYMVLGAKASPLYALDFDASSTDLWAIDNSTLMAGTIDLVSGVFVPTVQTNLPASGATGMTAAVDGTTWYVSSYDGVSTTNLYVGDVSNGNFTLVGAIDTGLVIDIAISSAGALYGHSISSDSLLGIDTLTGAGTLVGPTGIAANFAQGMDFDWSTDILYATIYEGGGVGSFCSMDLVTGVASVIELTTPLNGEFEMAIQQASGPVGLQYCFGDGTGTACPCGNTGGPDEGCANSSGAGGRLEVGGGTSVSNDATMFSASNLLPNQPALAFSGLQALNGGNGVPFGDGLRCAGNGVVRLGTMVPDATGDASWGPGLAGLYGWMAGDQRFFQVWYRDPLGSPCTSGFNLTNGWEVTFTP